jgi:hypothetical protein
VTRAFALAGPRLAVAALALLAWAPDAAGQAVDPGRALRGLFVAPSAAGSSVSLAAEVYEGVNSGSYRSTVDSLFEDGAFTGLTTSLSVNKAARRTSVGATATTMMRYYAEAGQTRRLLAAGAIGLRHQMRRSALELTQSVAEHPTYDFGSLRGLSAPALGSVTSINPDHVSTGYMTLSSTSAAALSYQLGKRQWISGGYRYTHARLYADGAQPEVAELEHSSTNAQEISVGMTRQVWQKAGVNLHYVLAQGHELGLTQSSGWIQSFNVGLDKLNTLSLSRSTTLSISGGTSVLRDLDGPRYVLIGGAGINQQIGRDATAGLLVRRDVHFVEGLPDAVLRNGLEAHFAAGMSRRWGVDLRGSGARGRGGYAGDVANDAPYTSYAVNLRFLARVAGPFALYGEYVRAHQDFEAVSGIFADARPIDHNGIRVGLTMMLPIYSHRGVK